LIGHDRTVTIRADTKEPSRRPSTRRPPPCNSKFACAFVNFPRRNSLQALCDPKSAGIGDSYSDVWSSLIFEQVVIRRVYRVILHDRITELRVLCHESVSVAFDGSPKIFPVAGQ
jgi:hypothetical protein